MASFEIDIRKLACITNSNAKHKSFKPTVDRSQFDELLEDIWPERVWVRVGFFLLGIIHRIPHRTLYLAIHRQTSIYIFVLGVNLTHLY